MSIAALTHDEFERAVQRMRLAQRTREMAYAVLVEGKGPTIVAERYGVTRQAADNARQRVWKQHLRRVSCPDGWVVLRVCVPRERARELRLEEERLLLEHARRAPA